VSFDAIWPWDEDYPREPEFVDRAVSHLARHRRARPEDTFTLNPGAATGVLIARGDGLQRRMQFRVRLSFERSDSGRFAMSVLDIEQIS